MAWWNLATSRPPEALALSPSPPRCPKVSSSLLFNFYSGRRGGGRAASEEGTLEEEEPVLRRVDSKLGIDLPKASPKPQLQVPAYAVVAAVIIVLHRDRFIVTHQMKHHAAR